jgi:hypothetical protein
VPEPSKAPWYFLGLQELVAHSAFMGGIGIPSIVLIGLALIPYLDRETEGTGVWFGGPGGGRLVVHSAVFGLAAVLIVEAFVIRFGWFRQWWPSTPQLVITLINPGTLLTVLYAFYSLGQLKYNSTRAAPRAVYLLRLRLCGAHCDRDLLPRTNWDFYWSQRNGRAISRL